MKPYTQQPPYFGQWGEDRWVIEHLVPPAPGTYVDVGAGDGCRGSNTLHFERLGWTGLCVDPDPRNWAALALRSSTVRNCAVSPVAGPQPFSMYYERPSRSGLGNRGEGYHQTTVECRPLCELLREADIELIDLLSIDVEGDELAVWDSFEPERHRPSIIIVEYDNQHKDRSEERILRHLGKLTYEVVHRTPANLILRRLDRDRAWPWRS